MEVVFFAQQAFSEGQESEPIDVGIHKVMFVDFLRRSNNPGGFHVYFSDDLISWNHQTSVSPDNANPHRFIILVTKGRYYKMSAHGLGEGRVDAVLY